MNLYIYALAYTEDIFIVVTSCIAEVLGSKLDCDIVCFIAMFYAFTEPTQTTPRNDAISSVQTLSYLPNIHDHLYILFQDNLLPHLERHH
jgi:hypothetical protein